MKAAVIVTGSERRFHTAGQDFAAYLRREVHLKYVSVVDGWRRDPDELADAISFHAIRTGRQPFLLAYFGHGIREGWAYGYENQSLQLQLSYERLWGVLTWNRVGPTLLVNDCCYGAAFSTPMLRRPHDDLVGVIAASQADGVAYGNLGEYLLKDWRQRQIYAPKIWVPSKILERQGVNEFRCGAELDHHFFPKRAER